MLIINTGVNRDTDESTHWYNSDQNSLQSTILLTFMPVAVLIVIQFLVQLVRNASSI